MMRCRLGSIVTVFLVGLFLGTQLVTAATTDSFTAQLFYGEDAEVPTVPDPVTVTPIAATQIDITWGASTDDVAVAGYQLFRDSLQIATTSQTFYSDTDLTASTTYSYNVVAFDVFGKFSTSSVVVSTTTFPAPVPPEEPVATTTNGSATIARLQLDTFTLIPSTNSVRIEFSTNFPTRYLIRYGKSSVYDDGALESGIYRSRHETAVYPLEPGVRYVYELIGFDRFGREVVLKSDSFETLSLPDTTAPDNPANFTAAVLGEDVFLQWDNPQDNDFVYVRVLRNHLFYPLNVNDGFLVYEGPASDVMDTNAFAQHSTQYYTVFAFDSSGNRSSGSVVRVDAMPAQGVDASSPSTPPETDGAPSTTPPVASADMRLRAEDIVFRQGNNQVVLVRGLVTLGAYQSYELSVPAAAVPDRLKSIIATVQNPTNNKLSQSFLLRYDEVSNSYLARIAPFSVIGDSTFTVAVYDYSAAVVHEVTLPVRFVGSDSDLSPFVPEYVSYVWSVLWPLVQLLLIGLTFIWFIVLWRRR